MSSIDALVRPAIRALVPYASARSLTTTTRGKIFLDANESADAPVKRMNRYPEPQPAALLARFAELYGVATAAIVIGRGSDEAIDLLVRTFCEPSVDRVLICPPTYGVYEVAAAIQGCAVTRVPLLSLADERPTFALDVDAIVARAEKLIFLCSPNNPTGTAFDPDALATICARTLGRSIVVVDEAYAEFSDRASMLGALAAHPNLVVLRTLSKARALAGVRCGVAIASPEIIAYLQRVRAPYPIATPQLDVALAAIAPAAEAKLRTRVADTCARRDHLATQLAKTAGVRAVYASAANFLLVRFSDDAHARVLAATARAGIVLRDRSREPGLAGCIRITIGTDDDIAQVLVLVQMLAIAAAGEP